LFVTTLAEVTALVSAHVNQDHVRFRALTLSIAANVAARSEHSASQLRKLVERVQPRVLIPLVGADGVLSMPPDTASLDEMVVSSEVRHRLDRVVLEYKQRDVLSVHGLYPARKLLFVGPPGTGKTMGARALSKALELPLIRVELHAVIASHLGETAAKLAKVFEHVRMMPGVYLFDEFDALGADRSASDGSSAAAEMRRAVNSLLQFIEDDRSDSLIVAATNLGHTLDTALFRRFDEVITFAIPSRSELVLLLQQMLTDIDPDSLDLDAIYLVALKAKLGHADICAGLSRVLKDHVLDDVTIDTPRIISALQLRARLVGPS